MKPTQQRKEKRKASKKKVAKKKAKKKVSIKKKERHEELKKEKAKKAKKRRAGYERCYKDRDRKQEGLRPKVLEAGDGFLPKSKKFKVGKAEEKRRSEIVVNAIADKNATTRSKN